MKTPKPMSVSIRPISTLAVTLCLVCTLCTQVQAQTAPGISTPDAGRILQEQLRPQLQPPKAATGINLSTPELSEIISGGTQITLQSVSFVGNTRFTQAQLQAVLAGAMGKSLDLGGLKALANQISEHYRGAGYPFARAFIAPQALQGGEQQVVLRTDVMEGLYGAVTVQSPNAANARLAAAAQKYATSLQPGSVIESEPLERLSLTLNDLPGIKVTPIMRPGQEMGTGDLDLVIDTTDRLNADVGLDNQGNRYTGQSRVRANLDVNSPFLLGDQITLRSLLSEQGMRMAALGYSLPVAGSGLRATTSYSHTYYELGGSFASSQSSGTADVLSVGASYPLQRGQQVNLTLTGSLQHKQLNDHSGASASSTDKSSTTLPLALNFDRRDGSGITYGSVSLTCGQLDLGSTLSAADAPAQTAGSFTKINLDVARVQALNWGTGSELALFARLSAQQASKNLDSSEDFGLGGSSGVRAYPSGEGYGDAGWLAQLELRYAMGAYAPYVFYDAGSVRVNVNPWSATQANAPVASNERSIAGLGIGVRYQRNNWSLDAALAWRTEGGLPQSDTQDQREQGPQVWVNAGYKF